MGWVIVGPVVVMTSIIRIELTAVLAGYITQNLTASTNPVNMS
jgi:hypothetical protein